MLSNERTDELEAFQTATKPVFQPFHCFLFIVSSSPMRPH